MGEVAHISRSRAFRRTTQFITALTIAIATIGNVSPASAAAVNNTLSVNDYSQCANGAPGTSTTPPNGCTGWINGDLNSQNSQYREDQVVPQRLVLTVGTRNNVTDHTIQLQYLARKGSANAHAYDSLATWNYTQSSADRCQSIAASLCVGGPVSTLPILLDPTNVPPATQGGTATSAHQLTGQVWTMYGGTLTSQSSYTHSAAASPSTDDQVTVTVHYTSSPGATVMLLFGGHLAAESGPRGWGAGLGASSINGGPYHISLMSGDGGSIGGKDNNIQSNAILPQASLSITKTADSATVNAGGQVGFTITVTNNGSGAASGVTVTDNLPNTGSAWTMSPTVSGCTISGAISSQVLSCTLNIAANSAVSIHVISTATNPTACGTLSNTATFTSGSNTGSAGPVTVTVTCPSLTLTKVADSSSVDAGSQIGYTITITNTGNGTATGVKLSDTLPTNPGLNWSIASQSAGWNNTCAIAGTPLTLTCGGASGVSLAPNGTLSVHITSPTTAATCGTVSNGATVTGSNFGTITTQSPVTVTVNCATLSLTKVADSSSVDAGSQIGYTITITNNGAGTATGVKLSDVLPTNPGLNWTIASQSAGWNNTCVIGGTPLTLTCGGASGVSLAPNGTLSVHITSPTTGSTCGTVSNSASVSTTNDGSPTVGPITITVNCPSLTLTKVADSASVSAGSQIGYTITITNSGTGTATGVKLSDALPTNAGLNWTIASQSAGWNNTCVIGGSPLTLTCGGATGVSLAPNGTLSIHITSPTTAASCGTVSNGATVTGSNFSSISTQTITITVNCPSLTLTKVADSSSVSAGSQIGYTITITNNGTGTATGVKLSDTLPTNPGLNWTIASQSAGWNNTCVIGGTPLTLTCGGASGVTLAPNGTLSVHITSPTTAATCGTVSNGATVTGSNFSTITTQSPTTITVNCPSLTLTKTPDSASVSAGQQIGYTITITNSGTGTATGVKLSDTLPTNPGLNWTIASQSAGWNNTCVIGGTPLTLTCGGATGVSLAPNGTLTVHITSPTTAASCGTVSNGATVTGSNFSTITTQSPATITVNCPNVGITKTPDSASVNAGQQIGYTITVTNSGAGSATNVVITDTLPNNGGLFWTIASITPTPTPPDGCSISNANPQVLTCHFASLAPNASVAIHIVSPTTTATCGTVSNSASVTLDNGGSAQTLASTITVNCAVLHVSKSGCPASVVPGGLLTYTISYSNSGAGPANNAVLVDTIPNGTQVADAGGGTVSGNTVTWNLGTIPAGGSGTKTLVVLVTAANGSTLTNNVTLSSSSAQTSASFQMTTPVTNAGAITHGSAYAVDVNLLGTKLIDQYGKISTVAPGSPQVDASHLLVLPIPGVLTLGLLDQLSQSSISNNEAVSTASSTVADVNLLGGAIVADLVRGVSQSVATPNNSSYDSTGSNFVNLVIYGRHGPVAFANVSPNTSVTVYNPLLPSQKLASVVLYEESGSASFANNKFTASHQVNMIHVTLLAPLGTLPAGAQIIVSHANTDATYPSGLACGTQPNTVSGKAFTAYANGTFNGSPVVTAQVGDAELPPFGGANSDNILAVAVPPLVNTGTGVNVTSGSITPNPNSQAYSVVHSTNLLDGLITADLIDVKSGSTATGSVASTTFGSTCGADACPSACVATSPCFVNLSINGQSIVGINGGTITPNTVIAIPQPDGSLIEIILNEQITAGDGTHNTEGTINAIHVYVLKNQAISAEVIVASAHSDAHHS